MSKACAYCGKQFVPKNNIAKYCPGGLCQKRAQRAGIASRRAPLGEAPPPPVVVEPVGGVAEAVRRELVAAGRESTAAGVLALDLATRLDVERDTRAAVAAVTRLQEQLDRALVGTQGVDELDEVTARRVDKIARARSSSG